MDKLSEETVEKTRVKRIFGRSWLLWMGHKAETGVEQLTNTSVF